MPPFSLSLLGAFQLTQGSIVLTRFRSNKARALLALLASEGRKLEREKLASLFWPDAENATAKQNLRQTLSRLRKLTGSAKEPLLLADRRTVWVNEAALNLDIETVYKTVQNVKEHAHTALSDCAECLQRLDAAAQLLKGDFLEGFSLPELSTFEEWLLIERERFRQQALDLLAQLTDLYERQEQFDKAQRYAALQLKLEPWREEAYLQLIRVLGKSGERSKALAAFQQCKKILAEELGVEPSTPLLTLVNGLKNNEHPGYAPESQPSYNLPSQLTPFFGRENEIELLDERLRQSNYRLLTLLGPGGVGKTRLAIEVGVRLINHFKGVYFVPLVGVTKVEDVPTSILQSLGIGGSPTKPAEQLKSALQGKRVLLILDNLEHLEGVKDLLLELLLSLPTLLFLVTTRVRLGVQAEDLYFVAGLPLPRDPGGEPSHSPAVRLFVDRAHRLQKVFKLGTTNINDVIRICTKVEGLPLAIELAASWVEFLGCAKIAETLEENFNLLDTDLSELAPHHRSIRTVFERSWTLLTPKEQHVLACLSVFQDSFTVDAAQQIVGASIFEVTRLRYKSLLRVTESGRLATHELLRQFAASKVTAEDKELVAAAHGEYYLTVLAEQAAELSGRKPKDVCQDLQKDLGNMRQAWLWALNHQKLKLLEKSVVSLARFYSLTGLLSEGYMVFSNALIKLELTSAPKLHIHLLTACGNFAYLQNRFEPALEHFDAATVLAKNAGYSYAELHSLCLKSEALYYKSDYDAAKEVLPGLLVRVQKAKFANLEARCLRIMSACYQQGANVAHQKSLLEMALAKCREIGDAALEQRMLINLGVLAAEGRDLGELHFYTEAANKLISQVADSTNASLVLNLYGYYFVSVGHYEKALEVYWQAQKQSRERGDKIAESFTQHNVCLTYTVLGHLTLALEHGEEALRLARESGALHVQYFALMHLAYAQLASGLVEKAKRGFSEAYKGWKSLKNNPKALECRAGLAATSLQVGDLVTARKHATKIEPCLNPSDLHSVNEPMRIYLICFKVFDALGDVRADKVLEAAYKTLHQHAASLTVDSAKQTFLNRVPFNREICTAWQKKHRAIS